MSTRFNVHFKASVAALFAFGAVMAAAQTVEPEASNPAATQKFTLDIAKAKLAADGTINPSGAQLATATSQVQAMRDAGMGWGAIANSLGLRLGDVVSNVNKQKHTEPAETETAVSAKGSDNRGGHGSGRGGGNGGGNGGGGGRR